MLVIDDVGRAARGARVPTASDREPDTMLGGPVGASMISDLASRVRNRQMKKEALAIVVQKSTSEHHARHLVIAMVSFAHCHLFYVTAPRGRRPECILVNIVISHLLFRGVSSECFTSGST